MKYLKQRWSFITGPTFQPSTLCDAHDFRVAGVLWTKFCVPNGASSIALKLKDPSSWAYFDSFEFNLKGRNKLRVNYAWYSKRCQH